MKETAYTKYFDKSEKKNNVDDQYKIKCQRFETRSRNIFSIYMFHTSSSSLKNGKSYL